MTNTTSAIHHFLWQASTEEQLCSHTHTEQSQAENLFRIFPWARLEPGLFQTLGWTWTRLHDNNFGHRHPQITSRANLKPDSMSDIAGSFHSHGLALNYKGLGGKVTRALTGNAHPSRSSSQITLSKHGAGEWLILHQLLLASFSQPGFCLLLQCVSWLLHLCPPQHLFQNNLLPLSAASFQSLLGWGRGLRLLRGLAAIAVPQLVK